MDGGFKLWIYNFRLAIRVMIWYVNFVCSLTGLGIKLYVIDIDTDYSFF